MGWANVIPDDFALVIELGQLAQAQAQRSLLLGVCKQLSASPATNVSWWATILAATSPTPIVASRPSTLGTRGRAISCGPFIIQAGLNYHPEFGGEKTTGVTCPL